MKKNLGVYCHSKSSFIRNFLNNPNLYNLISKEFSELYIINIENLYSAKKNTNKDNEVQIPNNFIFIKPKTFDELENFLISHDLISIINIGRKIKYFKLFRLFKKYKNNLILIDNLGGHGNSFIEKNSNLSLKNLIFYFTKNVGYYFFRFLTLVNYFPSIEFYFISSKKASYKLRSSSFLRLNKIFPFLNFYSFNNIIPVSGRNQFISINQKDLIEDYIVFIDSDIRTEDIIIREGNIKKEKEIKYINKLKDFLVLLKIKFKKKIIICLHPKSDLDLYKNYFREFDLVKFQTTSMIRKAFIVIFHESTVISDAIFFKKRIICLDTRSLGNYFKNRINLYNSYDFVKINLDENYDIDEKILIKDLNSKILNNYDKIINEMFFSDTVSGELKIINTIKNI